MILTITVKALLKYLAWLRFNKYISAVVRTINPVNFDFSSFGRSTLNCLSLLVPDYVSTSATNNPKLIAILCTRLPSKPEIFTAISQIPLTLSYLI